MMRLHRIAIRLGALFLALVICQLAATRVHAATVESGDFVEEVERLKNLAFARDSGLYVAPSAAQQAAFSALATTLLSGDLAGADTQAEALDYELVEFTDTLSGAVYHGLREVSQTRGWGSYFVNLAFQSDALVETPHVLFDTNSWEVGALTFRESGARGFLMTGAHRNANGTGTADVAHLAVSIYQEVHKAWNGTSGETTAWQIHGFALENHSSFPPGSDAVLSNGDGNVFQEVIDLDTLLEAQGFLSYAYNALGASDPVNLLVNDGEPGTTFSSLAGTTNVQGIHSRDLGGVFVHVELERSIRFDTQNRAIAASAIAAAIFDVFDTVPPLLVRAEAIDATSVAVSFTEDLDSPSATTVLNYGIDNGVSVFLAVLYSDGRSVILDTSPLSDSVVHTVTVNDVQDLAGNTIAPNSQTQFEYLAPVPVHVEAIDMEMLIQGKRWRRARVMVTLLDDANQSVMGASVSGAWSGLVSQNVSNITASDGIVVFESDKVSGSSGEFVFTVTSIIAEGYDYDPSANVESSDCITAGNLSCGGDPGGEPGNGTGTIRGTVKDQNGTKLAGATVDAEDLSDRASRGGKYRIDQVPAGEAIDVIASASGCSGAVTQSVTLAPDQTLTVDFTGVNALQCN
ncbi:MAG: Ig-like domain-containing protein [Gammaproteobacteria bacterium]|nr:Ig-like domain-containing protein [Gammaproteobacteria bacterium]